jgi:hypothetical protein
VSLEEEFSEELKKTLAEVREMINKEFKDEEDKATGCAERSIRLQKISENFLSMLKSRQDEILRRSDLVTLSSIVCIQSQIQSELAIANARRTRDLKAVVFSLFEIPLTITVKILSRIVDTIPKVMTKERNAVKEELGKLSQQIVQVEKREKEITIEIPEKFEETFRWLEEQMKIWKRGQEEARKMRV